MKKQKFSTFQISLGIIIVLVLVLGALLVFINPESKPIMPIEPAVVQQIDTVSKPMFRKDGELKFVEAKTVQIISAIDIEIADDDREREQGLMYRDEMAETQGMLFLMGTEEVQAFWMKNTILSLDIIYANSDKRIVSIHPNTKPYSLDQIVSGAPASLVVEVNAGYTQKYGIKAGDLLVF